ncbi:Dual specificity phosphatase [Macleaya cordata]|uniref:Dual specificity phosphatase n=1 Tax=Macleaya cordata TaxID=56857 RepID=A0A200Q6D2_MACCD|nr:Dual specificity phosphatase [Macleaya cordata]
MGISKLIGLKATVLFFVFAFLKSSGLTLLSIPFVYASLVALLVSIASHPAINLPLLLGKSTDGSFPLWSIILFAPFLYFVRFFGLLRRLVSREPPYSEICEGVYVGGWPYSLETLPPGDPAIIDCTCELPRTRAVSQNSYLCIPTWDTRAPQPSEIESAVRWACRKKALNKPIFIHCAFGHGRSVAVMCALLVALGVAEDWKNAEKIIRERRPCIRMNSLHRKSLEEWSEHRLSPKMNEGGLDVSAVLLSDSSERSQLRKSEKKGN